MKTTVTSIVIQRQQTIWLAINNIRNLQTMQAVTQTCEPLQEPSTSGMESPLGQLTQKRTKILPTNYKATSTIWTTETTTTSTSPQPRTNQESSKQVADKDK